MLFPDYLVQAADAADDADQISQEINILKSGEHTDRSGRRVSLLIRAFSEAKKRQARALALHESFATEYGEEYLSQVRV
jgi:hypothetical protein